MSKYTGVRYCATHQGNHSHHEAESCVVCKLLGELAEIQELSNKNSTSLLLRGAKVKELRQQLNTMEHGAQGNAEPSANGR